MKRKELKDFTYDELVDHVLRELHTALLRGGGTEMRCTLFLWADQIIRWGEAQKK